MNSQVVEEEFEDTKGVIRIRKSKKTRQHNAQKKKCKKTNNDLQNMSGFREELVQPIYIFKPKMLLSIEKSRQIRL